MGSVEYQAVADAIESTVENDPSKIRGRYVKFTDAERFEIEKYAAQNGNTATIKRFKSKNLKESTVRTFKVKYYTELEKTTLAKRSPKKTIPTKKRGRPVVLGEEIDVQNYLRILRSRGSVVNTNIAIATALGFLRSSNDESINDLVPTVSWAQSLFCRMRFVRRFATTGKNEIPDGIKKEAELLFIHDIVHHIERNKISESMVLNIDQTPLKYVPCGKTIMAEKSSSEVPINGVSGKWMITATFTISLDGKLLPIQLIYAGKTERSIPKIKFPKSFLLSANPTHFSNETESLKLMKEIVIPYFLTERKKLGLAANHSGLIIMDVFKGQTTDAVQNLLKKNSIFFTKVSANMTSLFQPLNLTVNSYAKSYLKKLFTEWFAKQIADGVNSGKDPGSIEVPLQLSILKPLQAK